MIKAPGSESCSGIGAIRKRSAGAGGGLGGEGRETSPERRSLAPFNPWGKVTRSGDGVALERALSVEPWGQMVNRTGMKRSQGKDMYEERGAF